MNLHQGGVIAGRYRLQEKIGAGGMAVVWLARDERLGRDVAVKIISDALAEDDSFRRRFKREAETAAGLSHPNLVTVHDFGDADGRPFLVMEHIDGQTLAQTAAQGKLGPAAGKRLAAELLGALGAAHAAGVIHRDVKPANVLIDRHGHAHLTDFGIARSGDATQLTEAGMAIGTLEYMAPEVKAGGTADERSDLYSLGILLQTSVRDSDRGEMGRLIAGLTDEDPDQRPSDASAAAGLIGLAAIGAAGAGVLGAAEAEAASDIPATAKLPADQAPTVVRGTAPTGSSTRGNGSTGSPSRRALAAAAIIAVLGAVLAMALAGGSGSSGQLTGTGAKQPTQTKTKAPSDTDTAPVQTAPAETTTPSTPALPTDCEELANAADAIGGLEKPPGDDPYEDQRKYLEEALKDCGKTDEGPGKSEKAPGKGGEPGHGHED